MRLGVSIYGVPAVEAVELAVLAEEIGFDGFWLGEHVVLPGRRATEHPTEVGRPSAPRVDLGDEHPDPWCVLAAIAASTERLRLATGIHLLPLSHPLFTARAAVTLQEIAGGRFALGIGAGWLEEEFEALDVPFGERGSRLEEGMTVLRKAWGGGQFGHEGGHFRFDSVQVTPRPVEVPIVLGGNGERALRRAAARGDAWYASGVPAFEEAVRLVGRVRELREREGDGRPLPCYVRSRSLAAADAERYAAAGVDELVLPLDQLAPAGERGARRAALERLAPELDRLEHVVERLT